MNGQPQGGYPQQPPQQYQQGGYQQPPQQYQQNYYPPGAPPPGYQSPPGYAPPQQQQQEQAAPDAPALVVPPKDSRPGFVDWQQYENAPEGGENLIKGTWPAVVLYADQRADTDRNGAYRGEKLLICMGIDTNQGPRKFWWHLNPAVRPSMTWAVVGVLLPEMDNGGTLNPKTMKGRRCMVIVDFGKGDYADRLEIKTVRPYSAQAQPNGGSPPQQQYQQPPQQQYQQPPQQQYQQPPQQQAPQQQYQQQGGYAHPQAPPADQGGYVQNYGQTYGGQPAGAAAQPQQYGDDVPF